MKQTGLTQQALAERMNCTQQYVSKILKGNENLSLDTLSKLEEVLGMNLLSKSLYKTKISSLAIADTFDDQRRYLR